MRSGSLTDNSLELARSVRLAIRKRDEALAPVIQAYDEATDQADRELTAAELVVTAETQEYEYQHIIVAAILRCLAKDSGAL